jgi:hypothetical protein
LGLGRLPIQKQECHFYKVKTAWWPIADQLRRVFPEWSNDYRMRAGWQVFFF